MPSAKKSSINIEFLNFRNFDSFLPRIGDEAKWAPWKVGCRCRMATSRPNKDVSFPSSVSALSRSTVFAFLPISFSIRRCTITSDDDVVSVVLGGGDGQSTAECAWTLLLCCMEAMANAHNGGGPLLALSPSIPGCLESSDGSKLPSEGRANNEGWLGWLQCRSVS